MRTAFLAGSGHVLMTITLGITTAFAAKAIMPFLNYFTTYITSGILITLGIIYFFLGVIHRSHNHPSEKELFDKASAISLFLMLTFSPCEAMIPIFFAASPLDWNILIALSLIATLGTIGGMLLLIHLTLMGYKKLHLMLLEENERKVMGIILFALGILAPIFG